MMEYLDIYLGQIYQLCKENKVKSFYAYGSVVSDVFTKDSDLDFIVSFLPEVAIEDYSKYYFDLLFSLEKLTGREIDLMTQKEILNPFLRERIEENKTLLYAAA